MQGRVLSGADVSNRREQAGWGRAWRAGSAIVQRERLLKRASG